MVSNIDFIHFHCISLGFAFIKVSMRFLLFAFSQFWILLIDFGHFRQWQRQKVKLLKLQFPILNERSERCMISALIINATRADADLRACLKSTHKVIFSSSLKP
jgi:hypothetical protein